MRIMETGDNMEKGVKVMAISAGITASLCSIVLFLLDLPSPQVYIIDGFISAIALVLLIVMIIYYRRKFKNDVEEH